MKCLFLVLLAFVSMSAFAGKEVKNDLMETTTKTLNCSYAVNRTNGLNMFGGYGHIKHDLIITKGWFVEKVELRRTYGAEDKVENFSLKRLGYSKLTGPNNSYVVLTDDIESNDLIVILNDAVEPNSIEICK